MFKNVPESEKYIFQGRNPGTIDEEKPTGEFAKKSKHTFVHRMLDQEPIKSGGGEVRITDSKNFPISKTIAAAHVIIQPGAIREMHWHPTADEWSYFLKGRGRVTIFASQDFARTFNYQAGDVGIVPKNMGHYVENTGDEPLHMLEMFRGDEFRDISLAQWMGGTPKKMVMDHLFSEDEENGEKFWAQVEDGNNELVT